MDTWMKVTVAVTVPALAFLVLNDTVQGFYGASRDMPLSYSVIEEEEPAPEEEAAAPEDDAVEVADVAATEEAPADEAVAETVSDDATTEDLDAADEAPVEETAEAAAEEAVVVEDAPVEEVAADAVAEEAQTEEAAPVEDAGTVVALLTPEEMDAGEAAARACASCHQFERERNAAGPHLVGLAGRTIGSVDGFRYSRALQDLNAEGRVWDKATLQVWLENPDAFADGTRMMYQVNDAEERRLIAGWLTQREN